MADRNFNGIIEILTDVSKEVGEILLKTSSLTPNTCGGFTNGGTEFNIEWAPHFLILRMLLEDLALISAFSKAMKSRPFCRYIGYGMVVFEWSKIKRQVKQQFTGLEIMEDKGLINELQRL